MKKVQILLAAVVLSFSLSVVMANGVSAGTVSKLSNNTPVDVTGDGKADDIKYFKNVNDDNDDGSFTKFTVFVNGRKAYVATTTRSEKIAGSFIETDGRETYINIYTIGKKYVTLSVLLKYDNEKQQFSKVNSLLDEKKVLKSSIVKASSDRIYADFQINSRSLGKITYRKSYVKINDEWKKDSGKYKVMLTKFGNAPGRLALKGRLSLGAKPSGKKAFSLKKGAKVKIIGITYKNGKPYVRLEGRGKKGYYKLDKLKNGMFKNS